MRLTYTDSLKYYIVTGESIASQRSAFPSNELWDGTLQKSSIASQRLVEPLYRNNESRFEWQRGNSTVRQGVL
jgi:hypothetical protein